MTRTHFPSSMIGEVESLTDRSIPIFKAQKGFISITVYKDLNDGGTASVLQWERIEDHEACMKSPDWGDLNDEWNAFMDRDNVHFEFVMLGSEWKNG